MRIAVVAFSACGAALGTQLKALTGHEITYYVTKRHSGEPFYKPFDSVRELTAELFNKTEAFVFVGACGIAVRAIAPFIKSKLTDPAVVVCDETGRFTISLLSGHAGGANKLAEQIAAVIGSVPVITTASDSHALLGNTPLHKNLVLGIGCRRGISAETIERAVTILLWDQKIPLVRVAEVATIDVKADEEGMLKFTKAFGLPLSFYSAEELAEVQGDFSSSERVLQAVGVDNVCERAAVLCGGRGKLILKKTAKDGVTVAVCEKESARG
ncbi:MAG: cobalamin biosynthesis protein CbiG [Clostridiales bacterium]|nr:cobalamin biosynthesis protein CbiG [Clostridiales bacterium]